jgi:hypothetical protein
VKDDSQAVYNRSILLPLNHVLDRAWVRQQDVGDYASIGEYVVGEELAGVVLCQEDAQASCCARDGGRPSGAALQEEASNCHELLRPKSAVVNVMVKRRGCDRVMYGSGRRAQANLR